MPSRRRISASRPARRGPQRTDRISELVREVVATELERLDDDRLNLVTVTGVEVTGDLSAATVYYSALTAETEHPPEGVAGALEEKRWGIQQIVNRVVRARKVPQITFRRDDALLHALHIEDVLRGLRSGTAGPAGDGDTDADGDDAP